MIRNSIFPKWLEEADVSKFSPAERRAYEESLKYYRDLKNVVDTAYEEGYKEGGLKKKADDKVEKKYALSGKRKVN